MKIIAALLTLGMTGTVFAQESMQIGSQSGDDHMIEFNADSILNGALSLEKSKVRGKDTDNDLSLDLRINYAYRLPMLPRIQAGWGLNYKSGVESGRGDIEDYGFNIAAYFNQKTDLKNTGYLSVKWGIDWANTYGGDGGASSKDEVGTLQLALGRRVDLSDWGIKHLNYTPEVAFVNKDSTTRSALEYSQSLELRFLQFSVFF